MFSVLVVCKNKDSIAVFVQLLKL